MIRHPSLAVLSVAGFLAAAAWPLANYLSVNYSQIAAGAYGRIDGLFWITAGVAGMGLLLALVAGRLSRGLGLRTLAVLSVGVFLLFNSSALRDVLRALGVHAYSTGITAAGLIALCGVAWAFSRAEASRVLVSLASVVALAMALAGLVRHVEWLPARPELTATQRADATAGLTGENVYLIVVDEYAGAATLADLGFDNGPFIDQMVALGFQYDPEATSNYIATHVSMMALLEASYPVTETSERYTDRSGFYPAAINRGIAPALVRDLSASGYRTVRISNWWGGCSSEVFDICVEGGDTTMGYAVATFLQPTILGTVVRRLSGNSSEPRELALELLQDLFDQVSVPSPLFLLVHHLSPHAPYARNADCSVRHVPDADEALALAERIPLYLAATQCVNMQLIDAVNLIIRRDPGAIVAIISDHGSDFHVDWSAPITGWSEVAIAERTDILRMMRLPAACQEWDAPGLGQINTARLIWSCLSRRAPVYLPERTYITAYEANPDFGLAVQVRAETTNPTFEHPGMDLSSGLQNGPPDPETESRTNELAAAAEAR